MPLVVEEVTISTYSFIKINNLPITYKKPPMALPEFFRVMKLVVIVITPLTIIAITLPIFSPPLSLFLPPSVFLPLHSSYKIRRFQKSEKRKKNVITETNVYIYKKSMYVCMEENRNEIKSFKTMSSVLVVLLLVV